ncbi:gcn5 family acetyltransferase [Leptolyngbya sp. Heron Island J]|uniref:GNAT family N-acetyltransferase n=1 Tax=Leptolyngbya sp. Heron Island J TaxID=1385935 RepID=UPI0003B97BD6|nr:GNAT family protein [Leptolyngbya sp. Heron Island J]ESA33783.1 gcn5 family acetyltransferase [Leptolyngbya sp. Heron Island J]
MFSHWIDERLELRSLQLTDAAELFALTDVNRAYLRRWLPWLDRTTTSADTRNFIRNALEQFADTDVGVAAICYDNSIVGVIGYNRIDWDNRIGHIGYWLAASHQGKGIMTRSCQCLVDYSFAKLYLNRIVICCATANRRSRAIPERLGFTHEGTACESEWLYDRFVDHEVYAMLRSQWHGQE